MAWTSTASILSRKDEAIKRLAFECLGYAAKMLQASDYSMAESYLEYARMLDQSIIEDNKWRKLFDMIVSKIVDVSYIKEIDTTYSARKRNYSPPEGYVLLHEVYHV